MDTDILNALNTIRDSNQAAINATSIIATTEAELRALLNAPVIVPDTTAPTLTGTLTSNNITQTEYMLNWSAATDNVAVTDYQLSWDLGATWISVGLNTFYQVTGRTPGTTDTVWLRALDSANNASSVLSAAVSLIAMPQPNVDGDMQWTLQAVTTTNAALPAKDLPLGQMCGVYLHGGGAAPLSQAEKDGQWWTANCTGRYLNKYLQDPFFGFAARSNNQGLVSINPYDSHLNPATGLREASYWAGFTNGPDTKLDLVSVRRLQKLITQLPILFPQINPNKISIGGNSMGAWGAATLIPYVADRLAYAALDMPRWRYANPGLGYQTIDLKSSPRNVVHLYATDPLLLSDEDGGGPASKFYDVIAYASNPANPLPPLLWSIGKLDGYTPWSDHIEMVNVLRATDRWFAFCWNNGGHGARPSMSVLMNPMGGATVFDKSKSIPRFINSSIDQDPAVHDVGFINLGFKWRNVVDTAGVWSCEVTNNQPGVVEVDVAPYNVQNFTGNKTPKHVSIPQNVWVSVSF